ncbi:DUF6817 domain-containing protein [Paraglaciecola sp. L3A3]|uniref:DUF6817 domain-containing protein n=1 Tax=Paraglaciecola sp. L3A3 TaxID=2686358 RepID=UPI00131AFC8C|nr:hypothetical protein [Paraglaciecola sp. L3A3]
MDVKFRQLIELGAGKFEHVDAALIEHLEGTRCTLKSWSANETLQDAGLYYLAYYGQDSSYDTKQRVSVANVLGENVEQLIYYYFCCDFTPLLEQIDQQRANLYHNFISEKEPLSLDMLKALCELDAAIFVDRALHGTKRTVQQNKILQTKFKITQQFLSLAAKRKLNQHFF